MSKLTKKAFAELTGVSEQHVNEYISRKKLVCVKNKLDTTNQLNALFIAQPHGKAKESKAGTSGGKKSLVDLEREKKELDIEKVKKEIALLGIKETKQSNESILAEHVAHLIEIQSEAARISWENAANEMLTNLAGRMSLTRAELTQIKAELIPIVNKAITSAVEESKKKLRRLAADHSQTRSKGEKK